jgi:hypothetical protein
VALLTGGRVKIGYQAGLKLLRAGASLIVTTRFPRDSAARYAAEPDFENWGDRLEIFGLDLRHTPSVEAFCSDLLATRQRLDFIINNACQTVRRPPEFYAHMMEGETAALQTMPAELRKLLGNYEGLRSADLLPGADATALQAGRIEIAGAAPASPAPRSCRRCRCWPTNCSARRICSPRAARPGPAAGRPARAQFMAPADGRGAVGGTARDPAGQRRRAVHHQRAAEAADAAHPDGEAPSATSTSSTCRRWRASSTGTSRPPSIRTPTWPRPRST